MHLSARQTKTCSFKTGLIGNSSTNNEASRVNGNMVGKCITIRGETELLELIGERHNNDILTTDDGCSF